MACNISDSYLSEMIRAVRVQETETSKEEVKRLIQTALKDLSRQGAVLVDPDDPLIKNAVVLYCRGNYGYDSAEVKAAFQKSYENASASIALDYEYKGGDAT